MPVVIPVVAAFAAGAAGVAAAATATTLIGTIAAYATVAGAVLTGVGAVTGSKDLMKIGAVLSIGGGLTSLASSAASGGAEAAAAASDAGGGSIAAEGAAGGAAEGTAAQTAAAASDAGNLGTDALANSPSITPPAPTTSITPDATAPAAPTIDPTTGAVTPTTSTPSIMQQSQLGNGTAGTPDGMGDYGSSTGPGAAGTTSTTPQLANPLDKLQDAAKDLNNNDLNSWWEKAKAAGGAVGSFIKDNPALVKIGGDALGSMFGPQAEQLDWQKSIYNQNRARLNAPVALTYKKG